MALRKFIVVALVVALASPLVWAAVQHVQRSQLVSQAYEPPPPGMVFVPAGEFLMGSNDPTVPEDERPLRRIFLPAFYIDKLEITNREYQRFKPDHKFAKGQDDYPVTHVLRHEAQAFCESLGKRLPTNAEWEKAARGTDGRIYPWGNEFKPELCNMRAQTNTVDANGKVCHLPLANSRGKLPPGSFPMGASPYGCMDMAGNVWEWVGDDFYDAGIFGIPDKKNPRGIIRGGAYGYSFTQGRASYQALEAINTTCNDVGFRGVKPAVPKRR